MLTVELDKKDLISLVHSIKPNMDQCIKLEQLGVMKFNGNQHNESWCWNREFTQTLTEQQLYVIYITYKKRC